MFWKRELEGELIIDHRDSPGLPGLPRYLHSPTYNCSHCERLVVMNPDRSRQRGYCPKCDRYVCDQCEAERIKTGVCRPFKKLIDEFVDRIEKGKTWHAES